jgi:uncharacterized protein (DUF169 family)
MEKLREITERVSNLLKLKSQPVGVSYLREGGSLPQKVRIPRKRGKRITLCQGMIWARLYGWAVAIQREDNLCIPGGLALNLIRSPRLSNAQVLSLYMEKVGWVSPGIDQKDEWFIMDREYKTLLLEPTSRASRIPDLVVIYGDPSQIVKLVHGYSYSTGEGIASKISGRMACSEYLVAPYLLKTPVITIPGTGDRVFSGTQDGEMVLSMPFSLLEATVEGLEKAGASIGSNRYPFLPYMLHEVKFPPIYQELARELGIEV